jgi:hypothetical protein
MHDGNVKIVPTSKIFDVSPHVYFVSKDQITPSTTVVIGQYVIERNVTLLHNDNVDSVAKWRKLVFMYTRKVISLLNIILESSGRKTESEQDH